MVLIIDFFEVTGTSYNIYGVVYEVDRTDSVIFLSPPNAQEARDIFRIPYAHVLRVFKDGRSVLQDTRIHLSSMQFEENSPSTPLPQGITTPYSDAPQSNNVELLRQEFSGVPHSWV